MARFSFKKWRGSKGLRTALKVAASVLGLAVVVTLGILAYQHERLSLDEIDLSADLTPQARMERDLDLLGNLSLSDGQKGSVLLDIAQAYKDLGKDDLRVKSYEEVLDIDAHNKIALTNLADFYEKKQDWDKAEKYIRPLLEVDGNNINTLQDALKILCKSGAKNEVNLLLNRYQNLNKDDAAAQAWVKDQRENIDACRFL